MLLKDFEMKIKCVVDVETGGFPLKIPNKRPFITLNKMQYECKTS